jgi:hypothetical protein
LCNFPFDVGLHPANLIYMSEELESFLKTLRIVDKAIGHLEAELVKIRAGKANPQMLDGLVVDYYGSPMPINQVSNISVMDARTLTIRPGRRICYSPLKGPLLRQTQVSHLRMMVISCGSLCRL